jgi:hypothetical protein
MSKKENIDTSICDIEWTEEEHEAVADAFMDKPEVTPEQDCDCVWPERCSLCR